ncbi:hypothetical protein ACIOHB_37240 [Streptomyces microflavus]|uniref:hypothetical protein n=1 Tax=Streptomyces microflavus TaxID=1919 RepID=UPI0038270686
MTNHYWSGTQIFGERSLHEQLSRRAECVRREVRDWKEDDFLKSPEDDVVSYLVDKYRVTCPVLLRDDRTMHPARDTHVVVEDLVGRRRERPATHLTFVIPFTGDDEVFTLRPDTWSEREWSTRIRDGELHISWTGQSGDVDGAHRHLEAELVELDRHLVWARQIIDPHNAQLEPTTRKLAADRRAKLLNDRGMEAALGIPVRRRQAPRSCPRPSPVAR